jgi:hypothetical protein
MTSNGNDEVLRWELPYKTRDKREDRGKDEGKGKGGRKSKQLLNGLKET